MVMLEQFRFNGNIIYLGIFCTDVFIGGHGAVFVMAGLFMNIHGLRYEYNIWSTNIR